MTLVIGNVRKWRTAGRELPRAKALHFTEFDDLCSALLKDLEPDIVLSPLLDDGFDALDVAMALHRMNFRGRFRVITPPLPKPAVVRLEIQHLCPRIDFDLIILDADTQRRLH